MKVACPSCASNLNIDDKKIPTGGARIRCPTCQTVFPVKPGGAAVPLPGITAQKPHVGSPDDNEPTRAVPLPGGGMGGIPGATTAAAPPSNIGNQPVPLPGTSRGGFGSGAATVSGRPSVPLPGITAAKAAQTDWQDEKTRAGTEADFGSEAPSQDFSFDDGSATALNPGLKTAAVPLPGNYQQTRIGAPSHDDDGMSGMPTAAVPLPGNYSPTTEVPAYGGQTQAVPLPGARGAGSYEPTYAGQPGAVPLPGARGAAPGGYEPTFAGQPTSTVPLPGARGPASSGVPLPGARASGGGVPLPGRGAAAAPPPPLPRSGAGAVPLPGNAAGGYEPTLAPSRGGARSSVPLPGAADPLEAGDDFAMPTASQKAAASAGFDFPDLNPLHQEQESPKGPKLSAQMPSFDDLPSPAGGFEPQAPAAPAPSMSFDDLPSPASPQSQGMSFDDLPAPSSGGARGFDDLPSPAAAPQAESMDFSDLPNPGASNLPSPASENSLDLDTMPPPPPARGAGAAPAAAPSFGEFDLGGGGDLEFDPTAAPKKKDDDLEVDLSAPIPGTGKNAGPGDALEMLSFIDQTQKEAGGKELPKQRRFHVRRRSGKVFGPFEEAVVVKMLEDGQLLGNEEVSLDSDSWSPIGSEPAFQEAIAKLMESPSRAGTHQQLGAVGEGGGHASVDRLKQLYEGRMAAVAVVQSKEPVPFKKRIPMILGLTVLVAVVGVGGFLATTPYGVFGIKVLLPNKVKAGSREFAELQAAQKAILLDTFKGFQQAHDTAAATLKVKEYPEARAIWCQAIFYLQRRYAAANPAELSQANAELENIVLLGKKHPEVVKALAGAALTHRDPDGALSVLSDALARSENADDQELLFLRAEAFAAKNQSKQAQNDLEAILKKNPSSAKAFHALGALAAGQRDADTAVSRYTEALKADPDHASSAVELAALELLMKKDVAKGEEAIDQALSPERRDKLGPAELGKALAVKAQVLLMEHKASDAVTAFQEALRVDPNNSFAKAHLAEAYTALHDLDSALPMAKQAAEGSPETLEYTEEYLSLLVTLGKMEDALKVVSDASKRFPGNASIGYLKGRVDDTLDKPKDAEEDYRSAVAADPKLVVAQLFLARLYLRFHRISDAKPQMEQALSKEPNNPDVHVVMGELALAEGNMDEADKQMAKALDLDPTLAEAYLGRSKVALEKGQTEVALQQSEKALSLDPHVLGGRLQHGTALWKSGRLEDAVKELQTAREEEPRNSAISVTMGAVQLEKGDINGAGGTLAAVLSADPSNPEGNFYMARVKNKKAEHSSAVEAMRRALEYQPKRADFHYWMGNIYLDAKKAPEAVEEWKKALELRPDYADALEQLGRIYLERNQVKPAVDSFEKALAADPSRHSMLAAIGDAYMNGEQFQKAVDSYEQALKSDPNLKSVYSKLGDSYRSLNKFDKAVANYKKATQVDANNAEAFLNLGWSYKEQHQKKEAAKSFKEYLRLKPDADNKKDIEYEIDQLDKER